MTRRITLLTKDSRFESYIKTTALTLTKLNYQVDIFDEVKPDIDLVIMDFDNRENLDILKSIRKNPELKKIKIIGVIDEASPTRTLGTNSYEIFFKNGCDAVMTKKEFEPIANNILMY